MDKSIRFWEMSKNPYTQMSVVYMVIIIAAIVSFEFLSWEGPARTCKGAHLSHINAYHAAALTFIIIVSESETK